MERQLSSVEALVSFPKLGRTRRDPPIRLGTDAFFDPQLLARDSVHHDAPTVIRAGSRFIHTVSDIEVSIVEATNDTELASATHLHVVEIATKDGTHCDLGEAYDCSVFELVLPTLFAQREQFRAAQQHEPNVDIVTDPVGANHVFTGPVVLRLPKLAIPLNMRLTLVDDRRTIESETHFSLALPLASLPARFLIGGTLQWPELEPPTWRAEHVFVTGASLSFTHGTPLGAQRVSLDTPLVEMTWGSGSVRSSREVFRGALFDASTDLVRYREATGPNMPCIRTTIFRRPALIYSPFAFDPANGPYTAVLLSGKALSDRRRRALIAFIGYLSGGKAQHVLTESYSDDRKLSATFGDRGEGTMRKSPPLPLDRRYPFPMDSVVDRIPRLLEAFFELYVSKEIALEAVLHHYAYGINSSYSSTRILMLSIGLEALHALITGNSSSNEPIMPDAEFTEVSYRLCESLDEFARQQSRLTAEQIGRFKSKIKLNLNVASNTARSKAFWRLVGVKLSSADQFLLRRLRNESVHQGFLSEDLSRRSVLRSHRNANRLVNIFNRAFLGALDYDGPVLSADRSRWLQVRSGRTFPQPSVPQSGNAITLQLEEHEPVIREVQEARDQIAKLVNTKGKRRSP